MTGGLNHPAIDNTIPVMERSWIDLEDTSTHRPSTAEKEPPAEHHTRQSNPPMSSVRCFEPSELTAEPRLSNSLGHQSRWKGYHQDLYLSKWFRSLLVIISLDVMGRMALLAWSTIVRLPLFGNGDYLSLIIVFIGTPLIGSLIVWPLCGIFFSIVFQ